MWLNITNKLWNIIWIFFKNLFSRSIQFLLNPNSSDEFYYFKYYHLEDSSKQYHLRIWIIEINWYTTISSDSLCIKRNFFLNLEIVKLRSVMELLPGKNWNRCYIQLSLNINLCRLVVQSFEQIEAKNLKLIGERFVLTNTTITECRGQLAGWRKVNGARIYRLDKKVGGERKKDRLAGIRVAEKQGSNVSYRFQTLSQLFFTDRSLLCSRWKLAFFVFRTLS